MKSQSARKYWYAVAFVLVMTLITIFTSLYRIDSMPAGANGDVSWNSIEVLDWLDYGIVPHFIYAIHGPEPVIVYLSAITVWLDGVSIEAPRIVTAIGNVFFVLLMLPTIWWLFKDSLDEDQRLLAGCLGVLGAATSIHMAEMSRVGVQGTLMPPIVLLAVLCSAYAWQNNRYWQWILAGLAVSLTQYTYMVGRMMAVIAAAWFLHNLIFSRQTFLERWRGWFVMGFTAIAATLPNLYLFATAPLSFSNRLETSSNAATGTLIWQQDVEIVTYVWQKILVTLDALVFGWDVTRKVTDYGVLEPLYVLGLIAVVVFVVSRFHKIGYAWLAIALPSFLLPSILFSNSLEISPIRQSSMLPFWFILSSLGLMHILDPLRKRIPQAAQIVLGIVIVGWSVAIIGQKFYEYTTVFIPNAYANERFAWRGSQTDVDLSNYINANAEHTFLLPYSEYTRQNISWLISETFRERTSVFAEAGTIVYDQLPPEIRVIIPEDADRARHDLRAALYTTRNWVLLHDGQVIFLPLLRPAEEDTLLAALDTRDAEIVPGASGIDIAQIHTIETPDFLVQPSFEPGQQMDASFQTAKGMPELRLVGYRTDQAHPQPGEPFYVTLYWDVLHKPRHDYDIFVQFWDDEALVYGETHHLPFEGVFRTRLWQPGTIVPSQHVIYMNDNEMPVGRYSLAVGLYRPLHGDTLEVTGTTAHPDGGVALADDFRVAPDQVTGTFDANIQFDDLLEMSVQIADQDDPFAMSLGGDTTLDVEMNWHVLDDLDFDYSVFLHLTAPGELQPVRQVDVPLNIAGLPSGAWRDGDRWQQELTLELEGVEAGTYELWAGVYFYADGTRLEPLSDQPVVASRVQTGRIEVP